jgi:hypothetical protein
MARLANGNVMKKGRRNMIGVHEVAPCGRIGFGLIRVPYGLPLLAGELAPATFTVGSLESEQVRDGWMFVASRPRTVPTPVTLLADLYHMQHHRRVAHHHVPDDMPRVTLPRQHVVVEGIAGDPSVQGAGIVGPRKRQP